MFETIKLEQKKSVFFITLNRPEKRNAMNDTMMSEIVKALNIVEEKDGRAVVFQGEGKGFCAGADLNWMKKMKNYSFDENYKDSNKLAVMFRKIRTVNAVTVACAHGPSIGGAVGIIAACDIAIGTKDAVFSFGEVKLGIVPAVIGPYILARTSNTYARYFMLTGERFNGEKAKEIGLLHNVYNNKEELEKGLHYTLKLLLSGGKQAQRKIKKLLDTMTPPPEKLLEDYTTFLIAEARMSKEGQEGISAFFDKRKASWTEEWDG
jgi:methylglutaconyl-CoA hydratase